MFYSNAVLALYVLALIMLTLNFYQGKESLIICHYICIFMALCICAISMAHARDTYFARDFFMQTTFFVSAVYFYLCSLQRKPFMGLFMLPAVIFAGLFSGYAEQATGARYLANDWVYVHIPLTALGMALFLASSSAGIMYFFLARQLKKKKLGLIFKKYPSLATLEKTGWNSFYMGFVFFSAGLLTALIWIHAPHTAHESFTRSFYLKMSAALAVWAIAVARMGTRKSGQKSSRRTAYMCMGGSVSLVAMYGAVTRFISC